MKVHAACIAAWYCPDDCGPCQWSGRSQDKMENRLKVSWKSRCLDDASWGQTEQDPEAVRKLISAFKFCYLGKFWSENFWHQVDQEHAEGTGNDKDNVLKVLGTYKQLTEGINNFNFYFLHLVLALVMPGISKVWSENYFTSGKCRNSNNGPEVANTHCWRYQEYAEKLSNTVCKWNMNSCQKCHWSLQHVPRCTISACK